MRLAYLSSRTNFYGGEVHLSQLAQGMRDRGHDVRCVVRPASSLRRRLAAAAIPLELIRLVDWFEPLSVYRLRSWLALHHIEILHTHLPRDYFIAAVATAGTRVFNVGTRHQLHPISVPWAKRPFLRRFAAMIAVSEAVRGGLLASEVVDPDKVVTVHNGVAGDEPPVKGYGLRRAAKLTADIPVVGYVGRLSPEKGLETLLAAIQRLRRSGRPSVHLFIVGDDPGDGSYAAKLRQLARDLDLQEVTHFFGYVENAARACIDFDVQVVCSLAEPFGLVTLEGMAMRRPVVATRSGGSPEIIRDGEDGFLVPPSDPVALAERLEALFAQPDLRRSIGLAARQRVLESFSLEHMLVRTEAVYQAVLTGGSPLMRKYAASG
ncbi:MAG: glycosyltransferase family 4 protein [bacterium]